jgi:hypothetical protein
MTQRRPARANLVFVFVVVPGKIAPRPTDPAYHKLDSKSKQVEYQLKPKRGRTSLNGQEKIRGNFERYEISL